MHFWRFEVNVRWKNFQPIVSGCPRGPRGLQNVVLKGDSSLCVGLLDSSVRDLWSSPKAFLIHQILCTTKLPIAPRIGQLLVP